MRIVSWQRIPNGHLEFRLLTAAGTPFTMHAAYSPSKHPAALKNATSRARHKAREADERAKKGPREGP